ncbi:hypothetical protein [Croceitalea dokdonensis]|nr:hypothetical protein [Croceitalea dokdonensis]
MRLYKLLFLIVFVLTISVNVRSTITSYTEFYYEDKADTLLTGNTLLCATNFILENPIATFLSHTGLDTGFGFFAPNVASEYITEFKVFSKDSILLQKTNFPLFRVKETGTRVKSAYLMFEAYLNQRPDSMDIKKCDIFLKGLSTRVLLDTERSAYVTSNVYLYHHPLLSQLKADADMKPIYTMIQSKTYSRNEVWGHLYK